MNESRCSECNLNWWLFPPVKIDGEPMVRCIECKRTFQDTAERARDDLTAAREEIGRLKALVTRLTNVAADLACELPDPGSEAFAAIHCGRNFIYG